MSKLYFIQVNVAAADSETPTWENVQHVAGGNWTTRRFTTAQADVAKLRESGETRALRIQQSEAVEYKVTTAAEFPAVPVFEAEELQDVLAVNDSELDNEDSDDVYEDEENAEDKLKSEDELEGALDAIDAEQQAYAAAKSAGILAQIEG